MARGWEPKDLEEMQAQHAEVPMPDATSPDNTAESRRADAERKRQIQSLEMQRERILSERTNSPHRRSALELALADIERVLQELGWALKL